MISIESIQQAGLTEGEAKVYLALLKLGSSTSGPIIEGSGVANSIVYRILNNLIDKGLVSYITKEKTKYFKAANPQKILDYMDNKKELIEENKKSIEKILPALLLKNKDSETDVQIFEGFNGFITAWEMCYSKLKTEDEYHSWGVYPFQEERYHLYWQRDHEKRKKFGFKGKILFNRATPKETLKNRNSYWGCEARFMPNDLKTPAWFMVYKDVTLIALQTRKFEEDGTLSQKPLAIVITNKEIAETFETYFKDLWGRSKPFKD